MVSNLFIELAKCPHASSGLIKSQGCPCPPEEICVHREGTDSKNLESQKVQPSIYPKQDSRQLQNEKSPSRSRVNFSFVRVRTYNVEYCRQILGVSYPLALGSKIVNDDTYNIDDFETGKTMNASSCHYKVQRLSVDQRRIRLRSVGYSDAQIRNFERRRTITAAMKWAYSSCDSFSHSSAPMDITEDSIILDRLWY